MIEVKGLTKFYETFCALRDASFTVGDGEIFAFVGPNGAGKTTTIRILATVLEPTDGEAIVDGHSIILAPGKVRGLIGYMPDEFGVYPNVTVRDYLEYFAGMYSIPIDRRKKVVDMVLELAGIVPLQARETQELSKGMTQRLALAKILLHDPRVLILDEPAHGLDPRGRIEFRMILKELRDLGKTILISSHILTELSEICDSVAIIDKGRIITADRFTEIRRKLSPGKKYQIRLTSDSSAACDSLKGMEGILSIEASDGCIVIEHQQKEEFIAEVVGRLVQNGGRILEVKEIQQNLEAVFMELTDGK